MPDKNGNEIATMYVGYYGIQPQAEGETNAAFRSRAADALRRAGLVIDAHEVFTNRYHDEKTDDPLDSAMTGITGAVALALSGQKSHDLGHDLAAGVYAQKKERDPAADDALVMLAMLMGR